MKQILLTLALFTATILSAKVQKQTLLVDMEVMDAYSLMEYYYPQEIYGGLKLDSVVEKSFSDGWQFYCTFDNNGRLTKVENFSTYRFQVFFTYDNDGKCVQSIAQKPNMYTVQWEDVQKAEFKRDAKGRATEGIVSLFSDGKWQPTEKYEATYDAHDNCTLYTIYEYQTDLGTWKTTNIYKQEYTYNDKGLKTQYVYSRWDPNDGWTKVQKEEYEYDAQGRQTLRMYYDWGTSDWVKYSKTETGYSDPSDEGVVVVLKHTQHWNSSKSVWESYSIESYQYTNGKETWYRYSQIENSSLVIKYTRTTTYNSKGQVILEETENTSGSKSRIEYMYDDFGNLIALQKTTNDQTTYSIRYYFSEPQSIPNTQMVNGKCPNGKSIKNGVLLIEHNGLLFNASGARIEYTPKIK